MAVASTSAVSADESDNALLKCRAIADDTKRLACYDKLAENGGDAQDRPATDQQQKKLQAKAKKKAKAIAAVPAESENVPVMQAEPAAPAQPIFGEEDLPKKSRAASVRDIPLIQVNVVEMKLNAYGKALFYLENGQVWEQADRLRPRRYSTPFTATIKRASMGSYMIQKVDSSVRIRVTRKK